MSGALPSPAVLQAAYANYDDEALAALASIGLLRRAAKDVEAGKVAWHPEGGAAAGSVAADGQRVQLALPGPAAARCDCPAPGVCKHVLAAALWLRAAPASPETGAGGAASAPPAPAPVLDEVLALDAGELFKAAGPAAVRKAAGMLERLEPVDISVRGAVMAIRLPGLDLTCRYVGGTGYAGMVSEAEPRLRQALHLLALAAVRHAHGHDLPWPDPIGVRETAAAAAADAAPGLDDDERRFLAQARALVHEVCASGWSHVSEVAAPQLRALATSARVESYPRLAGLLRGLAGVADLLARRDFGVDEAQALRLAAQAHALVHALEAASRRGDAGLLARLRGVERRSFEVGATLELLPLGAYWWEQRGGARGLSCAFWDPAAGRPRQAVLARRDDSDPGFGKASAWSRHALWPGAGPAARLAGVSLVLEQPRLAEDGRLGLGGVTRAEVQPAWPRSDPRWLQAGIDDWTVLRQAVAAGAGLLGEGLDMVLLRPAACEAPRLDEVHQELLWQVRDGEQRLLTLRLPYEHWKAARLDNLEAWAASGVPVLGIGARLERGGRGLLEPVSLIVERDGRLHPVSLDFDPGPSRPSLAARQSRMLRGRGAPAAARTPRAHVAILRTLLAQLERKAMSGHLHLAGHDDELHALRPSLLALGLDAPAGLLGRYLAAPDIGGALALYQVGQTCLELDTGFM